MNKRTLILCLIAFLWVSTSKAIVGNKVVVALNCGSKEETVEASDKVFKYEPV